MVLPLITLLFWIQPHHFLQVLSHLDQTALYNANPLINPLHATWSAAKQWKGGVKKEVGPNVASKHLAGKEFRSFPQDDWSKKEAESAAFRCWLDMVLCHRGCSLGRETLGWGGGLPSLILNHSSSVLCSRTRARFKTQKCTINKCFQEVFFYYYCFW